MSKFLMKMERKFGRYAIRNLSLVLIIIYAAGTIISWVNPTFSSLYLTLDPIGILRGQVWRIFTWVMLLPEGNSILVIITLYFYYSIGNTLERTWGTFLYNVYIFSGLLFTFLGAFIVVFIYFCIGGSDLALYGSSFVGQAFTPYYVNMSIFLAFAATYPNMEVLLMFIIPVKVKVLGIIYGVFMIYSIISGFRSGVGSGIMFLILIVSSMLNFLWFFLTTRKRGGSVKQIKRRHEYQTKMRKAVKVTKHKCAICGQTEDDNPGLVFRYCSKCEGNYEYCQAHLFTHEHVKKKQ